MGCHTWCYKKSEKQFTFEEVKLHSIKYLERDTVLCNEAIDGIKFNENPEKNWWGGNLDADRYLDNIKYNERLIRFIKNYHTSQTH